MTHDNAFIEAVNLAYHEEEAALYVGRHPEILMEETARWAKTSGIIAGLKGWRGRGLRLLDLGTGTGFVPRQLAGVLGPEDTFVLTDLSPAMLERARQALGAIGMRARTEYRPAKAEAIGDADGSFDVVTMNSVVHHFPDVEAVFRNVRRLLAPGGIVVIAHEPNALHFRHPIVGRLDRLLRFLRRVRGKGVGGGDPFIDRVNERLSDAGILGAPFTAEQIESVVDIHSPTAGRTVRAERGFDPRAIASGPFDGFSIELLLTYRHFGKARPEKVRALKPFVHWIERIYPDAGALFTLVLKGPDAPGDR